MRALTVILLFALFGNISIGQTLYKSDKNISVGAKQYESYSKVLKDKRVAVVGNHTSMVDSVHLVDWLLAKDVNIVSVFAPEHGFRGKADAGEKVESGKDVKTGLPIVSLYGSHKKPTPADLENIDVVIFDIQDVGARFYTYISTMTYVMEACAENDKKMVILDRPNPNGFYVDGPMLDPKYKSFVGMLPIPVVHGVTVGELARMINGEGWLEGGVKCDITISKCEGYTHNDIYILPVKPSPNLPNLNSILLYPSLCFFEGTDVSVGRGTDTPFEVFGHPNMSLGSHVFVPKPNEGSKHPKHEGVPCVGWDLTEFGGKNVQEKKHLVMEYMVNAYREFPSKETFFLKNGFINKLAGTDAMQKQIEAGLSADQIRASWELDLVAYKRMRHTYLLYPDFE
ncbi:MAG: DUF1343 domain-containing protein [Flavobacteriales bacterium]|jgi:uncharacterized protein YbbC (DUF1343 family)|nr:DUF1343 domain-containing protein [Flavobacteriales bacterium]